MSENNINGIIQAINNLNKFSWGNFISLLSVICAWITIIILLKDKSNRNRPYLQVSIELIRSSLACIVIKNVGEVSLSLKSIKFDKRFLNQLPKQEANRLENNKIDNLIMPPNTKWIFCLGVIIPEILEKYDKKTIDVSYEYKKIGGFRLYKGISSVDFEQISSFLVYISEIDELKKINEKIVKSNNEINESVKKIETEIISYNNASDIISKSKVAPRMK